jgi:mannose-6-phosphate isomerase-like protein (cupin superfamily)
MTKRLVVNESEGESVPDICGEAIELINEETAGSTKVSLAKLIIKPGAKSQLHFHLLTEEIYFILKGSGIITIEDKEFKVKPGDAIFLPLRARHHIWNSGEVDLVFVCADAPVFDSNDVYPG